MVAGEDVTQARVIHKTGISNTVQRDYSIINRVRSIDRTNEKFMKRTRSVSRSRPMMPPAQNEPSVEPTVPTTAPKTNINTPKTTIAAPKTTMTVSKATIGLVRVDSSNWKERGTKEEMGGVMGIVKNRQRSVSRGPGTASDRGRSSSKARKKGSFKWKSKKSSNGESDGEKKRGRSSSRGPLAFLRGRSSSNARDEKESNRGRSKNRRDGKNATKKGPLLPPLPPTQKVVEEKRGEAPKKEAEPEVDNEIDKLMAERQLIAEVEAQNYITEDKKIETRGNIDSLNDHDIMQLDEKNTTMHVACLLHHTTDDILKRLEDHPEVAHTNNNANETPLHYAAMDKRGVNREVLKKLVQLNPEAVKQPNVQNSLPVHLACMVGAPSTYTIKTFLKMYPKAAMIQSDFPLLFEEDMADTTDVNVSDDDSDDENEFISYQPKSDPSAVSGIASMFACAAPHQAALEMAHERSKRKDERTRRMNRANNDDGPKVETGFSPLHLAVMNSASPTIIGLLIKVNTRSIHLKTSRGRTALDCAQYIVRQHWLYGTDDENAVQNTFGAIELLEEALEED